MGHDLAAVDELVRQLGHPRAFRLAATGRSLPAAEALDPGLLDEVVAADRLADLARGLADLFASGPAHALALTKRQFRAVSEGGRPIGRAAR